jgi:hypothetical protein
MQGTGREKAGKGYLKCTWRHRKALNGAPGLTQGSGLKPRYFPQSIKLYMARKGQGINKLLKLNAVQLLHQHMEYRTNHQRIHRKKIKLER